MAEVGVGGVREALDSLARDAVIGARGAMIATLLADPSLATAAIARWMALENAILDALAGASRDESDEETAYAAVDVWGPIFGALVRYPAVPA